MATRGRPGRRSGAARHKDASQAEHGGKLDRVATRAPTARGSFRGGAADWSLRAAPFGIHAYGCIPRSRETPVRCKENGGFNVSLFSQNQKVRTPELPSIGIARPEIASRIRHIRPPTSDARWG